MNNRLIEQNSVTDSLEKARSIVKTIESRDNFQFSGDIIPNDYLEKIFDNIKNLIFDFDNNQQALLEIVRELIALMVVYLYDENYTGRRDSMRTYKSLYNIFEAVIMRQTYSKELRSKLKTLVLQELDNWQASNKLKLPNPNGIDENLPGYDSAMIPVTLWSDLISTII